MFRLTAIIFMALLVIMPAFAQQQDVPPDYRVEIFGSEVSADETEVIIRFAVMNIGGPATIPASVVLTNLSDSEVIVQRPGMVRPLQGSGDREADLSISFPVTLFEPGSNQALELAVGVGEIESEDDLLTITNNYASISVEIPLYEQAVEPTAEVIREDEGIIIPFLEDLDTSDPAQVAVIGGIAVSVLIIVLIVLLIFRLLFQRRPAFGNWQPPYATMPPLDPNSTYGRRQLWQQHAQNNVVPVPCKMGSILARKVLLGMDGYYLSGWRVTAIRMTQYDMYGRVSRSQVLATGGTVRRLDRTIRKLTALDEAKVASRVRPIARSMANQFKKKISKRSAMLPIALDVRLQGTHGEVRILFELYECRQGQPVKLDYWEPEMTVLGRTIHESYTFTIFGQTGGETFKAFRKRLSEDIERVLVDMLRSGITTTLQPPPEQPPDTLANTQPITQTGTEVENTQ